MKIEVNAASNAVLNWAMAKITGRALRHPVRATNEDVEGMALPFELFEVNYTYRSGDVAGATCTPIKVVRFGSNVPPGAPAPSIDFEWGEGQAGRGNVGDYYLTLEEAQLEARGTMHGILEGYVPTIDWDVGGPLLDNYGILFAAPKRRSGLPRQFEATLDPQGEPSACGLGPTHLIAAMRCIVIAKMGEVIEVPDDIAIQ